MKNLKIKDYIINNFKDDDINTLRNTIVECINENDEETLPGMGVFFELIWTGSNEKNRKTMLETLLKELKKNSQ
jgi:small acid-soluble spore protein I (minor)